MTRALQAVAILCALALGVAAADARPRQQQIEQCDNNGRCLPVYGSQAIPQTREATVIGGRPAGCPHAYCGCGASLYLFNRIRPELNLAWNWVKYFPRTTPAPRTVAANRHHVMVLLSHVSGNDWLVHDSNSGRGLTRVHVRSIRGYVIVDQSAQRMVSR